MSKAATTVTILLMAALAVTTAIQTARVYRLEEKYEAALARTQGQPPEPAPISLQQPDETAPDAGTAPPAASLPEDTVTGAADDVLIDEEAFAERVVNKAIEAFLAEAVDQTLSPADGKALRKLQNATAAYGQGKHNRDSDDENGGKKRDKATERSRQLAKQARDALELGEYAAAEELLRESLEEDPTNGLAYKALAQMQRKLGLSEEEIQTYKDWMDAVPGDALPHYQLATTYERMGFDAEALRELEQFGQMSQGNLATYPMMANLYRRLDMRPEEREALQSWVQSASNSPDAHRSMGDFYRRAGNYNAALNEYGQVVNLLPNNPAAYLNMGSVYERLRMYDAAQQQYAAAVELRPNDLSLHMQLGNVQRQGGDLSGALQTYGNVITLEPGSREAQQADRAIARIERQLARGKG